MNNKFILEMVPMDGKLIKKWYEFEGALTYEYAHDEVKAAKATLEK